MELEPKDFSNQFNLAKIAKHFSKLEYLAINGKPENYFIENFLLKLQNLKYFSIRFPFKHYKQRHTQMMQNAVWKTFDGLIELLEQILPYRILKRELMVQGRPILPYHKMNSNELLISSPNTIDCTFFTHFSSSDTYLFVKKLYKKGDSYIQRYFAYHVRWNNETTIRIVLDSEFNRN